MKKIFTFLLFITLSSINAQCWKNVATGYYHTAAIKQDGTLWTWGYNEYGQLGNGSDYYTDGSDATKFSPVNIAPGSTWESVATGWFHTVAIKSDGTLWGWGNNEKGQLGNGTTIDKNLPQQIGTDNDWVYISCGQFSTFALKTNGTLWACGDNLNGQLGDGTNINKHNLIQIGTNTNWKSIEAGWYHTLGLKTDGSIWGWGKNVFGQVGDNTVVDKNIPTQIGNSTNWENISASMYHSLAIRSNGTLWAWGGNSFAQLGNNSTTHSHIPIQIGTNTNWAYVEAGSDFSHAIKSDGTLWSWGLDQSGIFGSGVEDTQAFIPTHYNTGENWQSITTNTWQSVGIKSDNSLSVAGKNYFGELGNGTDTPTYSFITINCPALSIDDYEVSIGFHVYPNPVINLLNIHNPNNLPIGSISIYDITGKMVINGLTSDTINLEKLSQGIYYIKITSGHQTFNHKIIKQ